MAGTKTITKEEIFDFHLKDGFTIHGASKIVETVKENLKSKVGVSLHIDQHNDIDLAGIQSINFLKAYCETNKKTFNLKLSLNNKNKDLLMKTGFNNLT